MDIVVALIGIVATLLLIWYGYILLKDDAS